MSAVVTFIGLGQMGEPMARNLRKGVKTLYVYNRTKEKALSLIQDGASLLERPEDAFENGNIVFTMLANDMALEEVTRALLKTIKPGSIHVSMSTVSPELVHKLEKLHKRKGPISFLRPFLEGPMLQRQANCGSVLPETQKLKKRSNRSSNTLGSGSKTLATFQTKPMLLKFRVIF